MGGSIRYSVVKHEKPNLESQNTETQVWKLRLQTKKDGNAKICKYREIQGSALRHHRRSHPHGGSGDQATGSRLA